MSQLIAGLVSVTFRELSPPAVIELARTAGLKAIEWGGDIHVPATDLSRAVEVGRMTKDAGLEVAAYGSYYCLGKAEAKEESFASVLETAVALGAPKIRVWAGNKGAHDTPAPERRQVIDNALRVSALAQEQGIVVTLEYHAGTLTDTRDSVRSLMQEIPSPGLQFLWQPAHGESLEQNLLRLQDLGPRLDNVHVFHWWPRAEDRCPLAEGEDRWIRYLDAVGRLPGRRACLLEFVQNNSRQQLLDDATTLLRWIDSFVSVHLSD